MRRTIILTILEVCGEASLQPQERTGSSEFFGNLYLQVGQQNGQHSRHCFPYHFVCSWGKKTISYSSLFPLADHKMCKQDRQKMRIPSMVLYPSQYLFQNQLLEGSTLHCAQKKKGKENIFPPRILSWRSKFSYHMA